MALRLLGQQLQASPDPAARSCLAVQHHHCRSTSGHVASAALLPVVPRERQHQLGGRGGDGQCRPHRPRAPRGAASFEALGTARTSAVRRSPGRSLAISTGCKSPSNKEPGWAQARFINMNAIESSNSPQSTQDRRRCVLLPENTRSHQLRAGGEHSPDGGARGPGGTRYPCRGARPPGTPTTQPPSWQPRHAAGGHKDGGCWWRGSADASPQGWGSLEGRTAASSITLATPSLTPAVIKRTALQGRRWARWITASWALGAS